MAGRLIDCLNGQAGFRDMLALVGWYALITAAVQGARYVKRFYVRRFANNVNRRMKRVLYGSLVRKSRSELAGEGAGDLLTNAIGDVDDCAEGMRKFTTELFDTGVALAAYACMLLSYDWRLALTCLVFPPLAFMIAEKLKAVVQRAGAAFKKQSGALSAATLDRAQNVGQNRHLKVRLSKGSAQFDGIFFSATAEQCGCRTGCRVDAAFYLQVNEFRGNRSVQMQIVDIRPSLCGSAREG